MLAVFPLLANCEMAAALYLMETHESGAISSSNEQKTSKSGISIQVEKNKQVAWPPEK